MIHYRTGLPPCVRNYLPRTVFLNEPRFSLTARVCFFQVCNHHPRFSTADGSLMYSVCLSFWRFLMPRSLLARRRATALFIASLLALTTVAYAQSSPGPQPAPLPPPIVAPADTPYPGTISLTVDATNITDRVFNVHETIPVKGRSITLLYPEWLPGYRATPDQKYPHPHREDKHSKPSHRLLSIACNRCPWPRKNIRSSSFNSTRQLLSRSRCASMRAQVSRCSSCIRV